MASAGGFREAFPAFADPETYPDTRVQFWLEIAECMLIKRRWGCMYEKGLYLYTAHCLTMETQNMGNGDDNPGLGGAGAGAVTSDSEKIDDMSYSASYDTSAYASNGQLGSTIYGQMYLDLVRIIGAGGVQL